MTAADAAFPSVRPQAPLPRRVAVVLGVSIAVAGLVGLTLLYDGGATYADIARASGFERVPFLVPANVPLARRQVVRYDVATRVDLHERTLRYVLSQDGGTPRDPTTRDPLFTPDEQQHLADVRGVFMGVRVLAVVALAAAAVIMLRAGRRGRTVAARLVRDAALLAAAGVAAVAVVFALAFEPAFLAFHYVFFPQGNFLFDPATSDLLALYPEAYWYGVTLRIGLTFVGVMALVALAATLAVRSRPTGGSAVIVTAR